MGAFLGTIQDYGENCTTHGIKYIVERRQVFVHRVLWFIVVGLAILFAAYLSNNAYNSWQNDPIITTVSTTALPINTLSYPAITVCGQGMATDTLEKVLEEQFQQYLVDAGVNINGSVEKITPAEQKEWRERHQKESFPGLTVPLADVASLMTAPNPAAALGAKAVSVAADDARAPSVVLGVTSRPIIVFNNKRTKKAIRRYNERFHALSTLSTLRGGCPPGWVSTTTSAYYYSTYCYKVLPGLYSLEEGKKACKEEEPKSILLEFETRSEVDDVQLLLNDGHLLSNPHEVPIWIGAKYIDAGEYKYIYNQLEAHLMLGVAKPNVEGFDCARLSWPMLRIVPMPCDGAAKVICTADATAVRRRRKAEILDFARNESDTDLYFVQEESEIPHSRARREVKAPKFDVFLNPEKRQVQEEIEKKLSEKFKAVFSSMNLTHSFPSIFQMLWHSINPCFDIRKWTSDYRDEKSTIKRCWWKGVPVNCTAIFKTNPTDRGMCCTFNARAAEDIYKDTMFTRSVAATQKMNLLNSFEEANLPPGFASGDEPTPEIGKNRGLTIMVDSHANILSPGTVGDDFEGFLSVVNSPAKFPSITEKGFVIRPGHENLVAMGAVDTIADDSIRGIPASKRNCYFQDEYPLSMHKLYSQSGCVFECLLEFGKSLPTSGGCTPWFYPTRDTKMCDPWQTNAFIKGIFGGPASRSCNYCLPDCASTTYSSSVSATPLRRCDTKNIGLSLLCKFTDDLPHPKMWSEQVVAEYKRLYPDENLPLFIQEIEKRSSKRQYLDPKKLKTEAIFEELYDEEDDLSYNAYEKDIAVVHFFFQEPTVFQFRRSLRMTWVDFVGQIGGLLGLCIGFSLLSGVEIFYWFTLRLSQRILCPQEDRPKTPIK